MPFNPINYGNIAAQGENILAARQRRDPNSMQNQLLAAQLQNEQAKLAGGGKSRLTDPAAIEKEMQFLRYAIEEGYPQDQIDLIKQGISKNLAWMSDAALNRNAAAHNFVNQNKSYGTNYGGLVADSGGTPQADFSMNSGPVAPVNRTQPTDTSIPELSLTPTKASVEGAVAREKAKQTKIGTREGELVANRTKTDVMMAEAFGKNEMIGGQLANARRLANPLTVGWAGQKLADLAGSQANDLRLELQSIRANAGLDTIRDMKAAGGTVGQVTEAEWPKLESKYAALEQSGSLKEFNRRLDEFETQYKASLTRLQAAYKQDYGESFNFKKFMSQGGGSVKSKGIAEPTTDAEYNALPSGTLFIDPDDGKQYRKP